LAWRASSENGVDAYTPEDVARWRADFGFARRAHSIAVLGYTDDELLEWRRPFDELAKDGRIDLPAFERLLHHKYSGVLDGDRVQQKAQYMWQKFDMDGSNNIDFGEFIAAGLAFDVAAAKEKIRTSCGGATATFEHYAEDGFMAESAFFQLMCDFDFFVTTATDVRKLIRSADQDRDGLVSKSDFVHWVDSSAFELEQRAKQRSRSPRPPPEPENEE